MHPCNHFHRYKFIRFRFFDTLPSLVFSVICISKLLMSIAPEVKNIVSSHPLYKNSSLSFTILNDPTHSLLSFIKLYEQSSITNLNLKQ